MVVGFSYRGGYALRCMPPFFIFNYTHMRIRLGGDIVKNSDFKFFYKDGQYFCSVKLPIDHKPTVYMAMGQDNRPFEVVVQDIKLAFDLLVESYSGNMFIRAVSIARELPGMLGYKRATSLLKAI